MLASGGIVSNFKAKFEKNNQKYEVNPSEKYTLII